LLPLASALTLPERVPLNDRVLVVSAGGLGLVVAAALKHHRQPVFLTLPREDVVESVRKFGLLHDPGGRFDLVVAACDGPGVLENALYRAQPRGTVAVLGVPAWTAAGHPANAATADRPLGSGSQSSTVAPGSLPLLVRNELTVVGLGEGDIAAALERLAAREVCEILSRGRPAVFPLERGQEALHHAADPRNLRVVVDNLTH